MVTTKQQTGISSIISGYGDDYGFNYGGGVEPHTTQTLTGKACIVLTTTPDVVQSIHGALGGGGNKTSTFHNRKPRIQEKKYPKNINIKFEDEIYFHNFQIPNYKEKDRTLNFKVNFIESKETNESFVIKEIETKPIRIRVFENMDSF